MISLVEPKFLSMPFPFNTTRDVAWIFRTGLIRHGTYSFYSMDWMMLFLFSAPHPYETDQFGKEVVVVMFALLNKYESLEVCDI